MTESSHHDPKLSPWRWLWQYVNFEDDPPPPSGGAGEGTGEGDPAPGDESEPEFDPAGDSEAPFEIEDDETEAEAPAPEFDLPPAPDFDRSPWAYTRTGRGVDEIREFPTWESFVRCVADDSERRWRSRDSRTGDASWTGTSSFEEAVEMALYRGWPEGRELMTKSLALIIPRPQIVPSQVFDLVGAIPSIAHYCAGDPACMIDSGDYSRIARPIVRIDFEASSNSNVSAESMMLRGAAVLSLVFDLESRGHSVELRIASKWAANHGPGTFTHSIVIKPAGESLDLDRVAFAIAHPSRLRRLAFALLEQSDLDEKSWPEYGRTIHARPFDDPNIIFIPGASGRETPDSARIAVADAAQSALALLADAAD